jgi:DNA-binding GntR family transcriptional regulator
MDTAAHQHEKIAFYIEQKNFEKANDYCKAILETCIESIYHICTRMEVMLRAYMLKEATDFGKEMHK